MASYHITDNGPRPCSTTPDKCPYGREGGEHYDNIAEAQTHFEKDMESKHGLLGLAVAAKNRRTEEYSLYQKMERLEQNNEAYKKVISMIKYTRSAPSKNTSSQSYTNGRSKARNRMKSNFSKNRISRMASRGGRQLFKTVGPTPGNVIKLHKYLTKELQNTVK